MKTITSLKQLEKCGLKELEQLFRKGSANKFPSGDADGVVLLEPAFTKKFGELIWKGKNFNLQKMELTNRILGLRLILGKLRKGPSFLDGKQCLVIDYTKTSWEARDVIDELREISRGVFLGRAYRNGIYFASFALKQA